MTFYAQILGKFIFLMLFCLGLVPPIQAASKSGDVVGKVTVGYQCWFCAEGDGTQMHWWHWPTSARSMQFRAWPDMLAYTKAYHSKLPNLGDGRPALLYSCNDDNVIDTQIRWMADNNINTAALQRFNPIGGERVARNAFLLMVQKAAEKYHRKFYIMYDISGWANFKNEIKIDWGNYLVKRHKIVSSSAYARQNGKPVVCIWGMGFVDRPGDVATCLEVIKWFKNQGCYVIGGVPTNWQKQRWDSKAAFLPVYNAFDMISPWMVGRVHNIQDSDSCRRNLNESDVAYCKARGIDYQPCVLPGDVSTRERHHGNLMWHEFANMIQIGSDAIYVSMYDEYNEGNQILPTAESSATIPVGTKLLGLDEDGTACSADYYLRLTGDATRMLESEIPFTFECPTVPMPPVQTPRMPAEVTIKIEDGHIILSWHESSRVQSFTVKRAADPSGPFKIIGANVGVSGFLDNTVVPGNSYYYVVSATNESGEGPNSAPSPASF